MSEGAKSQRFGGSLSREGSFLEACVSQSEVSVFWWLALARRRFSGVSRGSMGAKSLCLGGSLCREGSIRGSCVGGS